MLRISQEDINYFVKYLKINNAKALGMSSEVISACDF